MPNGLGINIKTEKKKIMSIVVFVLIFAVESTCYAVAQPYDTLKQHLNPETPSFVY